MKSVKSKMVIFLCSLCCITFVITLYLQFWSHKELKGRCKKVLDGDTIIIKGERIRLKGIDAPEKEQLSLDKKKIGQWSRDFLKSSILGKEILIKYRGRGHFGRILGTVFLNGVDINELLLAEGYAIEFKSGKWGYKALAYTARLKRKGMYKTFGFLSPKFWRQKKRSIKER